MSTCFRNDDDDETYPKLNKATQFQKHNQYFLCSQLVVIFLAQDITTLRKNKLNNVYGKLSAHRMHARLLNVFADLFTVCRE